MAGRQLAHRRLLRSLGLDGMDTVKTDLPLACMLNALNIASSNKINVYLSSIFKSRQQQTPARTKS